VFEVLIQLGAILAIVAIYFQRLFRIATDALARKPGALRFVLGVLWPHCRPLSRACCSTISSRR